MNSEAAAFFAGLSAGMTIAVIIHIVMMHTM